MRKFRSRSELERARAEAPDRHAYETALCDIHREDEEFLVPAVCQACGSTGPMSCDWVGAYGGRVNFRERLQCRNCGLNSRQRFMANLLRGHATPSATIYLHEQVTPFYRWATDALPGDITGSEYLGPDAPTGTVVDGVRHEDVRALSFADRSVDVIASNDVFEHVPDIDAALTESARVLRPGGRILISVPFHDDRDETLVRATIRNGETIHLEPAEYHGNPVDPEGGSLVFYDHGWDFLERCRTAGFHDAYAIGYWSTVYGYLGSGMQTMLAATKA